MKSILFLSVLALAGYASAKTVICADEHTEILISLSDKADSKNIKDTAKVILNTDYTRDLRDKVEGGRLTTAFSQSKDKRSFGLTTQTKAFIPTGETDAFATPRLGVVHEDKHLFGLMPAKDGYETMAIGYSSRKGAAFLKTGSKNVDKDSDQIYLSVAGRINTTTILDTCVETEKTLNFASYLKTDLTALYWQIARKCATSSHARGECVDTLAEHFIPDQADFQKTDMLNLHKQLANKLKVSAPTETEQTDSSDSSSGTQSPDGVQ